MQRQAGWGPVVLVLTPSVLQAVFLQRFTEFSAKTFQQKRPILHELFPGSRLADERQLGDGGLLYGQLYGFRKPVSPTILRIDGYRFFFFSREEPRMHVHVVSAKGEAKYWLEPSVALARSYNYSPGHLWTIRSLVEEHQHELIAEWNRHFAG